MQISFHSKIQIGFSLVYVQPNALSTSRHIVNNSILNMTPYEKGLFFVFLASYMVE